MSYIGNKPGDSYLTLEKQVFTTSATDTYTLDREVSSPNDLELFLNNVRQEPTEAYTISGTTLTLASAITASDSMYCVYQGRAVGTQSPATGSVTNDMLAGSIASSKLADYEEGTWTPSTNYGTVTYADAKYTKIGRLVLASGYIATVSDITTASSFRITGLPFTANSTNSGGVMHRYINASNTGDSVHWYLGSGNSFLQFYISANNSNFAGLQHSDFTSTSAQLYFSIHYMTS